ncbi:hypothetical protein GCM10007888_17860 [Methylobacterium oxalidis]|uniref:Uncharacterized protein n=1 Tax=Methylobacterium oxalidis TaxID=944322 RepID=A0ABQ6DEY5_9HYPH|nr:hypothetical protein LDDCCGHA_3256 [Methylobacterium oxalidis]GLS63405.1 hypothetical protein GCM10007888_17860 [Methylobacterium oxalidis]
MAVPPPLEPPSTVVSTRESMFETSAALTVTSPPDAVTLPRVIVAVVLPSTTLAAIEPATPNLLGAADACAWVVRSRAFWAVSVTPAVAVATESVRAAVMSRSTVLMAEPRPIATAPWLTTVESTCWSSVVISVGSAMARATVASIAVTVMPPAVAERRAFSAVATVEPVRSVRAWIARASISVLLVATARSEAPVTDAPRRATRTVSLAAMSAAPALIGAASEPSSSPSPAIAFVGFTGSSGASVAAPIFTSRAPLLAACRATPPSAAITAGSEASGAVPGSMPLAATPTSTLVVRVTVWLPVSAKRLRMSLRIGMLAPSAATSFVVTLVVSVAASWTARAGSVPGSADVPACVRRAALSTVTWVVFVTAVSAFLITPSTASSAGVKTSDRLVSPLTMPLSASPVRFAVSWKLSAPGRTRPIALTSTVARVVAASLIVPPLTAPVAPTAMTEVLVCVGVMLLSCEESEERRMTLSTTSVVRAASPAATTLPSRVMRAAPVAVTDSVCVLIGAVSESVILLRTAIVTAAPLMTAPWLIVTPMRASAVAARSSPLVTSTGLTVASVERVTAPLARIVLPCARTRLLSPAPPWKVTPISPACARRSADRAMRSLPVPPSKVMATLPDATVRSVSRTRASLPAPPVRPKLVPGGRVARWSVSLPEPRSTPKFVVGAVKARLAKAAVDAFAVRSRL